LLNDYAIGRAANFYVIMTLRGIRMCQNPEIISPHADILTQLNIDGKR
jgi:hypothetical protein